MFFFKHIFLCFYVLFLTLLQISPISPTNKFQEHNSFKYTAISEQLLQLLPTLKLCMGWEEAWRKGVSVTPDMLGWAYIHKFSNWLWVSSRFQMFSLVLYLMSLINIFIVIFLYSRHLIPNFLPQYQNNYVIILYMLFDLNKPYRISFLFLKNKTNLRISYETKEAIYS